MNAHTAEDRLGRTLAAAIAAGVLPAQATPPQDEGRPWPVLLLTALGAWLAALPLLGAAGLLLGDLSLAGPGPYVVAALVLAGAAVVLRSAALPLFVEQLAVPALLVGLGTLGMGLFRDLPHEAAASLLAAAMLALGFALPRAWLRVLLGAGAAMLGAAAFGAGELASGAAELRLWHGWHAALALWLAAAWLQQAAADRGARGMRLAAALEALGAGWLLATLAGLAWWSGMSFLVGAGLGVAGEVATALGVQRQSWPVWLPAVSLGLAAAAALVVWRRWPAARGGLGAGLALGLLVLAGLLPALGAVLLALAGCATTQRWRLAAVALLAAAWIVGSFYYQLQWPLATKAALLAALGAALAALVRLARPHDAHATTAAPPAPPAAPAAPRGARLGLALGALAVLATSTIGIWQKETLIARGRPVYVELGPVDPRSLMQGDYMRLAYRMPAGLQDGPGARLEAGPVRVVAELDARGVATLGRIDDGAPLGPRELRLLLKPKDGRWIVASDAWYFREGEGERWAAARYGEFRVGEDGSVLLVGMADAQLRAIRP